MRFLLDANVLSEVVRPRPDSGVANWLVQIVTRNTDDFPPEVRTFNPWKK